MGDSQNIEPGRGFHSFNHRDLMNADYVSVREAAGRAKVSIFTIYRWIGKGRIQAYGHGHATRVLMGEVLAPKGRDRH